MAAPQYDAIIIGAGFGGMGAAIQLNKLGLRNLLILEREDGVGGTWHVNKYPGLAVDVASVTYSYSFEPNPYWSRLFAPGAELKRYADHVADKYDIRKYMQFGKVVEGAVWESDRWSVSVQGESHPRTARYLLTATGFLSQPYTPPFPGIDTFAGRILHTAAWDDEVELEGRRAAIIGTGATAVQLVPKLARKVKELTVFQRTPIWVVPKVDAPIPRPVQELFARVPRTQQAARLVNTAALEALMVVGVLHFKQAFVFNDVARLLGKANLFAQVRDRGLRRKLTPDYDFGCKRPTFSNDYFRTFNRDNVALETNSIDRIEPDGIVTAAGNKIEIDTLVLATGYNIWDVNFPAIEIIGREGRNLGKWWRDSRFQAYEGISMPYFPNLLSLNSPYSYSGLSYFTTIETQMAHIARLFGELQRTGAEVFEVKESANDAFFERVDRKLGSSVFYTGSCATANSYYFDPHGDASLLRPTSTLNARREARSFPLSDYQLA